MTTTKMSHSHSHSESDTVPLHPSSQSDINEIKNQINANVQSSPTTVLPAKPPSPTAPPSPSPPPSSSNLTSPTGPYLLFQGQAAAICPRPSSRPLRRQQQRPHQHRRFWVQLPAQHHNGARLGYSQEGPVSDHHQFEARRLPNPYCEDPGKALMDWGLCCPFFFIVFLGPTLSWSASVKKYEVFTVAYAVLADGAVILTLNVLLLVEIC